MVGGYLEAFMLSGLLLIAAALMLLLIGVAVGSVHRAQQQVLSVLSPKWRHGGRDQCESSYRVVAHVWR
jgi:hypothetical protein